MSLCGEKEATVPSVKAWLQILFCSLIMTQSINMWSQQLFAIKKFSDLQPLCLYEGSDPEKCSGV